MWHQHSFNPFRKKSELHVRVAEADACLFDRQNWWCPAHKPNVTAGRAVSIDSNVAYPDWFLRFAVLNMSRGGRSSQNNILLFLTFLVKINEFYCTPPPPPPPPKNHVSCHKLILTILDSECVGSHFLEMRVKREISFFSCTKKWIQSDASIISSRTIPPPPPVHLSAVQWGGATWRCGLFCRILGPGRSVVILGDSMNLGFYYSLWNNMLVNATSKESGLRV